jgi:hypothetical protein
VSKKPISISAMEEQATDLVIIQSESGVLKGYLEEPVWKLGANAKELMRVATPGPVRSFRIRDVDSETVSEVPLEEVKALFFAQSAAGNSLHSELHFHAYAPIADGIWMRVKFKDGEVMEGIVCNSIHYLVEPGFFLRPSDPDSNNKLIYVVKSQLVEHQVLGTRSL